VSARLVILALALGVVISLNTSAEERRLKHLPGISSFYRVEDVISVQIPTLIEN
jgi:hypothetical protein